MADFTTHQKRSSTGWIVVAVVLALVLLFLFFGPGPASAPEPGATSSETAPTEQAAPAAVD